MKAIALKFAVVFLAGFGLLQADVYLRPEVLFNSIRNDHYSSNTGVGFAFGYQFGATKSHLLELAYGNSKWSYSDIPAPDLVGSSAVVGRGKVEPFTVGYRYQFAELAPRIRPYVGVSVGASRIHGNLEGGFQVYQRITDGSFSDWCCTGSAEAGFAVYLSNGFSLDLGCRFSKSSSLKPSIQSTYVYGIAAGQTVDFEPRMGSLEIVQGVLGLRYTF